MIQKILIEGKYKFRGDLDDFKRCISSFKITKITRMGEICGVKMCDVEGRFRYHGDTYKVYISKLWNDEILLIEYRGEKYDKDSRNTL